MCTRVCVRACQGKNCKGKKRKRAEAKVSGEGNNGIAREKRVKKRVMKEKVYNGCVYISISHAYIC